MLGSFIFNCTHVPTRTFESELLQLINKVTKHSSSNCSGRGEVCGNYTGMTRKQSPSGPLIAGFTPLFVVFCVIVLHSF